MRATDAGDAQDCFFCAACFTGDYPCEVPEEMMLSKFRYEKDGCASVER
jgi:glutamine phosphoribosylpyrophosphate amidotransferase